MEKEATDFYGTYLANDCSNCVQESTWANAVKKREVLGRTKMMFTWANKYTHPKPKLKPLRKVIIRPLPILYEAERIAEANPQLALDMFARKR